MKASVDPVRLADQNWRAHGWDTGPYLSAALSVYRTDEHIRQCDDAALRPHGLTRARHEALAVLYFSRRGEMPLGKLGQRLLVHPTSVTTTVDTLERLGLAERVAHPTDRRTTLGRISPAGRRAMERSCALMAEARCGLATLDDDAAEQLFRVLLKVRAAAGDVTSGDGADDPVLVAERNWEARGWTARPHFRASLSVYRTSELIRLSNETALRPLGLTHVRHEALALLYFSQQGEMPMGKLGQRLLVHPTSATSIVDALERQGFVERSPHPADRRAMLARITPAGRAAIETSNRSMAEAHFGLAALAPTQARRLTTILRKVRSDTDAR